jgi:hypothetical protein
MVGSVTTLPAGPAREGSIGAGVSEFAGPVLRIARSDTVTTSACEEGS